MAMEVQVPCPFSILVMLDWPTKLSMFEFGIGIVIPNQQILKYAPQDPQPLIQSYSMRIWVQSTWIVTPYYHSTTVVGQGLAWEEQTMTLMKTIP